jgi:hypothetical protein
MQETQHSQSDLSSCTSHGWNFFNGHKIKGSLDIIQCTDDTTITLHQCFAMSIQNELLLNESAVKLTDDAIVMLGVDEIFVPCRL